MVLHISFSFVFIYFCFVFFFFFKQKTAYEMRISDWSSDVCSSDLLYRAFQYGAPPHGGMAAGVDRIVMLLCGAQNLREITLSPMNQIGRASCRERVCQYV